MDTAAETTVMVSAGCAPAPNYDTLSSPTRRNSLSPAPNERAAIEKVLSSTETRRQRESKVLFAALLFCLTFMVVELICGVIAHSLALLTDASHLMIDVGAYSLSIMSLRAASKRACRKYSYGWHRAEVIGTLVSVFSIWALVAWISIEALSRMWAMVACSRVPVEKEVPVTSDLVCKEINAALMLLVGVLGMFVNVICAAILYYGGSHGHSHFGGAHGHSHGTQSEVETEREEENDGLDAHLHSHGEHDAHNGHTHTHDGHEHSHAGTGRSGKKGFAIHAALLHALGDCVQSVGVIFAGAFIFFANRASFGVSAYRYSIFNLADPLCSLFFAVVTLYMTKSLLGDLLGILMESTPPGVDYDALNRSLLSIEGVVGVHDLHVWSLSSDYTALSVHIVADDADIVLRKAQYVCEVLFGISHTTIQVDTVENGAEHCQAACSSPTTATPRR